MSITTFVVLLTNTETAPAFPAGTIAALAFTRPSGEFRVETCGCDSPVGQIVRYPKGPFGTAVTLSEYASAVGGTPHPLSGTAKLRDAPPLMAGPPKGPGSRRVSITRQGGIVVNCSASAFAPESTETVPSPWFAV